MRSKCELVKSGKVKHKGKSSTEWYTWSDKPMRYCLGYNDTMTDEPMKECLHCEKHVSNAQDDIANYFFDGLKRGCRL